MSIFFNPFSRTDAPDTMTEERTKRQKHILQTCILTSCLTIAAIYGTPLIVYMWSHNLNFSHKTFDMIERYYSLIWSDDPLIAHKRMLSDPNFVPGHLHLIPGSDDYQFKELLAYTLIAITAIFIGSSRQIFNSHKRMVMKQNARWAIAEDLRLMEDQKQVGIRGGKYMSLGRWIGGLRDGQTIRMIETLSALCLAPPGTGKTAGVAIPTLVENDTVSIIAYDAKPELFFMTGRHRASVSDTHVIDWSKVDEHKVLTDDNGIPIEKDGKYQYVHTIYSRFNPLCKAVVPPPGSAQRDTYLESLANIIIPSPKEKKADYFQDQGRDCLVGFLHVIVAKINDDDENPNRWDDMPKKWRGKEASLPMLIDWYATAQFNATKEKDKDENAEQDPDPLGTWMRDICERVDPDANPNKIKGVTARGFSSLSPLVTMADRQRSGVLGTMSNGLGPFRNAAVQERMGDSDFSPDHIRGIYDEKTGTWRPFTLYICVNAAESDAFSMITTMLFESLSLFLLSYGPEEKNPNTGRNLGPYPVIFLLDEFARLKQIPAVLGGPDIGRSKKVSYLIIAQATPQIRAIYSQDHAKQIKTTTAVKIIFPQNEEETIKEFIGTVGKTTIRRASYSTQEGIHKDIKAFSWNRSEVVEEADLLRQEDLTSMPRGTHILLIQGFQTKPVRVKTVLYFLDPEMKKKVWARGCQGIKADKYVPPHIQKKHVDAWMKNDRLDYEKKLVRQAHITERSKETQEEVQSEVPF